MKPMRNIKRALVNSEAWQILENGEYGVLSTVLQGQPYGVPLNYSVKNETIFIHCAPEGHKIEAFGENPRVSFTVVGKTQVLPEEFSTLYESTIVFGTISEVTDPDLRNQALLGFIRKYSPDYEEAGIQYINRSGSSAKIFAIRVTSISGKARRQT